MNWRSMAALSQDTIQGHYSTFVYGTNTSAPMIVSAPAAKTVFAGASPVLVVQAAGTLPLSYQWSANSTTIPGGTGASLAVSNITANTTYGLKVQNAYGSTNISVVLTVTAPPAGYPATVMTDHPTALWRLADTSGQPAQDSAGFNDGVFNTNGVTYGAVSIPGEAGHRRHFGWHGWEGDRTVQSKPRSERPVDRRVLGQPEQLWVLGPDQFHGTGLTALAVMSSTWTAMPSAMSGTPPPVVMPCSPRTLSHPQWARGTMSRVFMTGRATFFTLMATRPVSLWTTVPRRGWPTARPQPGQRVLHWIEKRRHALLARDYG